MISMLKVHEIDFHVYENRKFLLNPEFDSTNEEGSLEKWEETPCPSGSNHVLFGLLPADALFFLAVSKYEKTGITYLCLTLELYSPNAIKKISSLTFKFDDYCHKSYRDFMDFCIACLLIFQNDLNATLKRLNVRG